MRRTECRVQSAEQGIILSREREVRTFCRATLSLTNGNLRASLVSTVARAAPTKKSPDMRNPRRGGLVASFLLLVAVVKALWLTYVPVSTVGPISKSSAINTSPIPPQTYIFHIKTEAKVCRIRFLVCIVPYIEQIEVENKDRGQKPVICSTNMENPTQDWSLNSSLCGNIVQHINRCTNTRWTAY